MVLGAAYCFLEFHGIHDELMKFSFNAALGGLLTLLVHKPQGEVRATTQSGDVKVDTPS
jgi:hypothetical protein